MRRILFVDDEPAILRSMQRSLRRRGGEWEMVFANGAHEALAQLAAGPFDVVVSDGRMPDMDGIALLKQIKAEHPLTVRIMLSGHADDEAMIPLLPVIYQFLSKPCETRVLESVLESALEVARGAGNQAVRDALLASDCLPPAPGLYAELTRALRDPAVSMGRIYSLVERDASLTALVLKTANSAYFGAGRQVSTVAEAARLLGVVTIRCLALFDGAFSHLDTRSRFGDDFVEWFHAHSFLTGRIAQALAEGTPAADRAFTAGLLHDMGALLIATRLSDEHRIAPAAVSDETALAIHEPGTRVTWHAEVGGWLLAHWGLPAFLVEAASRHHGPVSASGGIEDLTSVVHVADCLAAELVPGTMDGCHTDIEPQLVAAACGSERLEHWRALAARVAGAR
jgi:HD-like signal output (HDOD) protein/ActR/RegA family two-component response regulator